MKNWKQTALLFAAGFLPLMMCGQNSAKKDFGMEAFFKLQNKAIPGSPKLGQPILMKSENFPIKSGGMGWIDPVLFDWNNDGKLDLLVGEFISNRSVPARDADPKLKGSHIRVYLNVGTKEAPVYKDEFIWAQDKTGAYLNVITSCCIGFTPRFYDLNSDGYQDIITGSFPGHVTCYYGSKEGFEPPVNLEQKGMPTAEAQTLNIDITDTQSGMYWSYSSADFVDVDGDGLLDLITGGAALRVSRNIGTRANPVFDKREMLLDTEGNYLKICKGPEDWQLVGVYSAVPLITDWDQDGVPDMLVTSDYTSKEQPAVSFFKGVRQKGKLRFEKPVLLFESGDQEKQFPGTWLRTWVADWNNDGINDLLVGTSIVTFGDNAIDPFFSWQWEKVTQITKQSFRYFPEWLANSAKKIFPERLEPFVKSGVITAAEKDAYLEKLLEMAHEGRVYLFPGIGTHKK